MSITNLFADLPQSLPEEISQTLLEHRNVRIERIISHGHASPEDFWYDQNDDEWVLLLSGQAGLEFRKENGIRELSPGDFIHIPAHQQHRVAWTEPQNETIWLAIFFPSNSR